MCTQLPNLSGLHHCLMRLHRNRAILDVHCSEMHHHEHLQIEHPCGRLAAVDLGQEDGATVPLAMAWKTWVCLHELHCQRLVACWEASVP